MQYVRSISGSVSKTWNSINPATLSGAIDVIVVEQEDGSLACSPFHVRFGKFSLLRPYEKKVEFKVNNVKQNYSMKLGEGGEAFFIFETTEQIPEDLQTSPLLSPAASPQSVAIGQQTPSTLQEPDYLDLTTDGRKSRAGSNARRESGVPMLSADSRAQSDIGNFTAVSASSDDAMIGQASGSWPGNGTVLPPKLERSASEELLPIATKRQLQPFGSSDFAKSQVHLPPELRMEDTSYIDPDRPNSPPPLPPPEAVDRAKTLSMKLSGSNIPSHVTEGGDLMLDMTGYKSSEDEALRAEVIARKILAEELEGNYDIGALIGNDERGNLTIFHSEEAKEAASRKASYQGLNTGAMLTSDAASDPGYHSDSERSTADHGSSQKHQRTQSDIPSGGSVARPQTPPDSSTAGDPNRNYAKTLRLTSNQLKELNLKPGANPMSFSVNKATCQASMFYWNHDIPIVISDIDGTITKSDALGHVLNMIGRDWTHIGVAKLYTDIVANGYNIMYLTSRSVGQADTTRAYLKGILQEGYKLPNGPVIMSPDRTLAALRREVYLRKPEVFKMACLRDILNLFPGRRNPFYAGFGNRLTDALSYRTVNIPSTRIFTINSNAEVSLDLLTLNKYRSSYVSMREVVDHFFPPVSMLVKEGGEDFTDFNYWRDLPEGLEDFSASDSEDESEANIRRGSLRSEDEGSEGLEDDEQAEDLGESYFSRDSIDNQGDMADSMLETIASNDAPESSILEESIEEEDDALLSEALTPLANGKALIESEIPVDETGHPMLEASLEEPDDVENNPPKPRTLVVR